MLCGPAITVKSFIVLLTGVCDGKEKPVCKEMSYLYTFPSDHSINPTRIIPEPQGGGAGSCLPLYIQ